MKNKFIKNTFILILGGFITKLLGMLIKIIMTRNISDTGISLYMLTLPTYNLFITIMTLNLSTSISKLISENKKDTKKIISSSIIISIIISIIGIILLLISVKPITLMLHNKKLYYPLLTTLLSLPFISFSACIKGYFFGKNKMYVVVISNLAEQLIKIVLFILVLPKINNNILGVSFIIGSNMLSEIVAIVTLSLFVPSSKINLRSNIDINIIKDLLRISIPSTLSKLIGVISYFFEPIILTNLLLINGYSNNYISYEYGIINGYVIALLTLPSFFTNAISTSIIPVISNAYSNKQYKYIKTKIKQVIILSLIIGISYTLIVIFNKELIMNFIYNTDKGIKYINIMAIVFILLYLEGPINSILLVFNESKYLLKTSIITILIKFILMVIFSFLKLGIYSFIIPILIDIFNTVLLNSIKLIKITNSF